MLSRRRRSAARDRGDLVEGHGEDVVEDEGDSLRGREGVEDDEQCQPDRGRRGLGRSRAGGGPAAALWVRRGRDRLGPCRTGRSACRPRPHPAS